MKLYMLSQGQYSDYMVSGLYKAEKEITEEAVVKCFSDFFTSAFGKPPEGFFKDWRVSINYGFSIFSASDGRWENDVSFSGEQWDNYFKDYFGLVEVEYEEVWDYGLPYPY